MIKNRSINILKLIFCRLLVKNVPLTACNIIKSFPVHPCSRNLHKKGIQMQAFQNISPIHLKLASSLCIFKSDVQFVNRYAMFRKIHTI